MQRWTSHCKVLGLCCSSSQGQLGEEREDLQSLFLEVTNQTNSSMTKLVRRTVVKKSTTPCCVQLNLQSLLCMLVLFMVQSTPFSRRRVLECKGRRKLSTAVSLTLTKAERFRLWRKHHWQKKSSVKEKPRCDLFLPKWYFGASHK